MYLYFVQFDKHHTFFKNLLSFSKSRAVNTQSPATSGIFSSQKNMERATLAKRCIFIEADKRVKETDIKQIFSNVVQLTALKKETTDYDDQIKWILLFTTVVELMVND